MPDRRVTRTRHLLLYPISALMRVGSDVQSASTDSCTKLLILIYDDADAVCYVSCEPLTTPLLSRCALSPPTSALVHPPSPTSPQPADFLAYLLTRLPCTLPSSALLLDRRSRTSSRFRRHRAPRRPPSLELKPPSSPPPSPDLTLAGSRSPYRSARPLPLLRSLSPLLTRLWSGVRCDNRASASLATPLPHPSHPCPTP